MILIIFILLGLPALIILVDFFAFLFSGRQVVNKLLFRFTEVGSMLILPLLYGNFGKVNECCCDDLDTAVFSPHHQLTIGILIILCLAAYFYSSLRTKLTTPVLEILVNTLLLTGIVLNVFIAIHTN